MAEERSKRGKPKEEEEKIIVANLIKEFESLGENEAVDVNVFCTDNKIIISTFFEIYSKAVIQYGKVIPYEIKDSDKKAERNWSVIKIAGKRLNITLPIKTVEMINKGRDESALIKMGDKFKVEHDGKDLITLKRI